VNIVLLEKSETQAEFNEARHRTTAMSKSHEKTSPVTLPSSRTTSRYGVRHTHHSLVAGTKQRHQRAGVKVVVLGYSRLCRMIEKLIGSPMFRMAAHICCGRVSPSLTPQASLLQHGQHQYQHHVGKVIASASSS
jgi:hypothetical protein